MLLLRKHVINRLRTLNHSGLQLTVWCTREGKKRYTVYALQFALSDRVLCSRLPNLSRRLEGALNACENP